MKSIHLTRLGNWYGYKPPKGLLKDNTFEYLDMSPAKKYPDRTNELSDPDNCKMASDTARKASFDLEHNGFYTFLEMFKVDG